MSERDERPLDPDEWRSPRTLLRATLRAIVIGAAILAATRTPAHATLGYAAFPITLFGTWISARARSATGAALATFVVATFAIVAAFLQTLYVDAVLSTHSIGAGIAAVRDALAQITRPDSSVEVVVPFVYVFQSLAVAFAFEPMARVTPAAEPKDVLGAWGVVLFLALVVDS